MKMFPLFVSLEGKQVVVIGGGNIAQRRITTLLPFGCAITVIAGTVTGTLEAYAQRGDITWKKRAYTKGDCAGAYLVVSATDDRAVNHAVSEECRTAGCLRNIADSKEECDFYFPAVVAQDGDVIGITASGKSHKRAKQIADRVRALRDAIFAAEE